MNTFRKAGILIALIAPLAFGLVNFDTDARAQRTAGDTDECILGHGSPCSMDMTTFAYPVGDGFVAIDYF